MCPALNQRVHKESKNTIQARTTVHNYAHAVRIAYTDIQAYCAFSVESTGLAQEGHYAPPKGKVSGSNPEGRAIKKGGSTPCAYITCTIENQVLIFNGTKPRFEQVKEVVFVAFPRRPLPNFRKQM